MSLQVTGKNINVGDSFQTYVEDKLQDAIDKYVGRYLTAHVRVEKERGRFLTACSVRLGSGLTLESSGEGTDAYSSADAAFEHLEKRLRRHKRRLKDRHQGGAKAKIQVPGTQASDYVVELADDHHEADTAAVADHPLIVAETERTVHQLPVSDAVMRLDLTEDAFLVFRNASSGEINVVYRRPDGNIGWIDPAAPNAKGMGASPKGNVAGKAAPSKSSSEQPKAGRTKRGS